MGENRVVMLKAMMEKLSNKGIDKIFAIYFEADCIKSE